MNAVRGHAPRRVFNTQKGDKNHKPQHKIIEMQMQERKIIMENTALTNITDEFCKELENRN